MDLQGKVALVTGGAHRVGKSIALALAERGAHVAVHYHSSEDLARETSAQIVGLGVRSVALPADLSNPSDIETLFGALHTWAGRVDVLINSASAFQRKDLLDITLDDWDAVMAVNLRAPFLCGQHAARQMLAAGGAAESGVIVNIADIAGEAPWVRFPHHSVSKAGLLMLTKVMAKALAPAIRVNAVVPGPVLKPDRMDDARWQKLGEALPLKRTGHPQHVAQAVLALIENDFATGAVFHVDGGDSLVGSTDMI